MSGEGLLDFLTPNLKLEELESVLTATENDPKDTIIGAITESQQSILPLRLQFNDFIQTMSNIDSLQGKTPQEKFSEVRNKIVDLNNRLQAISEDFTKLQPLFDTIPEYSEKYGNKKCQPLETLKSASDNNIGTTSTTPIHVSGATGPAANNMNYTSIISKKTSKSNDGTPVSHASTPSGSAMPTSVLAAKKPRKPRQTKKAQAAAAAVAAVTAGNTRNQHAAVLSPTPPNNMINSTPANPVQMVSSVPPTSMTGTPINSMISPMGSAHNGFTLPQQQTQPQMSQNQRQQFRPTSRNNSATQSQLNLNNITPANILSMSMAADGQQQPPQQQQQQQNNNNSSNNYNNNNNNKEFDPLDFNNLDFGNFNMDIV